MSMISLVDVVMERVIWGLLIPQRSMSIIFEMPDQKETKLKFKFKFDKTIIEFRRNWSVEDSNTYAVVYHK